jgi:ABC-type multidrug transport system fused ATPase/permease subunit
LLSPVSALNNARHHIFSDIHAFDEYDRLVADLASHRQPSGTREISSIARGVQFNNVRFAYPGNERPILSGFNLEIQKGEMIALVGPSGAGKSTVAALLARLYDPEAGVVAVDGTDLREFDVAAWHRLLGVVSQEAFIFNDTLANNLRFAKPDASEDQLRAALRRAAADDILAGLPDGLQTMLGERGGRLSGGQVQRIALARVLLANPQLLILDEATSNLDSLTEAAIQHTIEEIRPGRTIVAIAHRLATIVKADRIVVMENGAISAIGTHAELEVTSGIYQEFLRHQAATAA